jgi:hypothetical protein
MILSWNLRQTWNIDLVFFQGTPHERGIIIWRELTAEHLEDENAYSLKTYDLPFGMSKIRAWRWTRYIPFCPTFLDIAECLPDCCSSSSQDDQKGEEQRIKNNDSDDKNVADKGNSSSFTKL